MLLASWFTGSRDRSISRRQCVFGGRLLEALEDRSLLSAAKFETVLTQMVPFSMTSVSPSALTAAPVIVSPGTTTSPGPVLTTSTPTFSWNAISGVTGYQININDNTINKFSSFTVGASVTSYTIAAGALAGGDSFVWNVRGLSGTASGPESAYLYFKTPGSTLTAPGILSPGTTASPGPVLTTVTPTLSWTAVSGATGYQININDNTTSKLSTYTTGASVTSFALPTGVLTAGQSYVWSVRALNGTASGPPSTYLYFQTPPAAPTLAAPVIVSPGSSATPGPVLTTSTPTLTWTAVTGVTGYQINVYDTTLGKLATYTTGASVTSYTLASGALTAGDVYVWNVRGLNGCVSGPESNYLYFQAPPAAPTLAAPVIVSPGSSASPGPVLTTLTPTLSWNAVSGATGYQINLYDRTLGKTFTYTTGASVTSYTVASGVLTAGDSFDWNVHALNGTVSGPASIYLYFQTPAAAPTLAAPVALSPGASATPGPVLTTSTPTLSWTAVTGVTGYQINLYDTTLGKLATYTTGASVTSYTVASGALTAGDVYVWNVRGLNGSVSGPESNYLYFQAPAAVPTPTLAAPIATSPGSTASPGPILTTSAPTFSWNAVTGATGYMVSVYDLTLGKLTTYTTGASVTSYTVASGALTGGDSFVWNVRALSGTVSGPTSIYLYFQLPAPVKLAAPVAVGPGSSASPGPILTTLKPTLTWNAVTGATGYQINLYDSTLGKLMTYTVGASVTSFTVTTSLVAGDSFVWNVRGLIGTMTGTESNYLYFRTLA